MTRFDLAYLALAPVMVPLYLLKLWRARRPIAPVWDRLSGPFLAPGEKPRIWVHAVSVGEALAARTLVEALEREFPGREVVVSASTETGRDVAARTYGGGKVFPCPLDLSGSVRKAFDAVRPELIVLMELEIWPNLLAEAERRKVPVAVVNGRLTERAARRYVQVGLFLRRTIGRVGLFCVQTQAYAERFKAIGAPADRVRVTGSMKYDAVSARRVSADERGTTRRRLGLPSNAAVVVGGSTHPTEEAALLGAVESLRERFPDLRAVVVPRHTNRVGALVPEIEAAGWKVRLRSETGTGAALMRESQAAGEVLVVDTMGELGDVYKAADAVFVGGSLIPHGGQNMMEPAGLGLPVLYGPHTGNFAETVALLERAGGGRKVADAADLESALGELLGDAEKRRAMGEAGRNAILSAQGATEKNLALLKSLV
ncbi:MAG: 3-deoxy-D-manno-octulosonic acid transferase [Planctomycetota bacterium]|jgi:3-deoxy-D-manno-octulosonic-acid transferase